MPRTRKDEAPLLVDTPVIKGRYAELDDYTVSFETFPEDADGTPAFRGLPDDRCPCPHWGMVISGRLVLHYRDHDESYQAGDVYYAPPGHIPVVTAGTETVEFSPTAELRRTMEVVAANMSQAGGAS
ncbi:hypothetical protein DWB77_00656 [Streptomyces hundungensis]|uniref:Cupin 2 conserved barrel domain-containing protein n=1 Tax=Streptomyces hundungensis TaxID=1077946 RepID=A0A387HD20_9ACTN|nr:cupin domain-containing protein [Streptomyces hundungensis]AYG78548.1 hypothetical protein DWB77_00656 [Streptomyces hundungensis]